MRCQPLIAALVGTLMCAGVQAQGTAGPEDFFDLPLEDLLSIEVSSVSRKNEALGDTAAATFVVTGDSIRQRGITTIAEALRGVPGVHVGRINASQWAISIRGFSGRYTNKLLVLVDGRSVYVPSFSGVYWDELDTLLDDVDRIEVIRGPGGTLWGPNAVNGVINIITRSAAETQGSLLVAGAGNRERAGGSVRYGAKLGDRTFGRVYAKYTEHEGFENLLTNQDTNERWDNARVGFRVDSEPTDRDTWTLQGDSYDIKGRQQEGLIRTNTFLNDYEAQGGNLLSRWTRTLDENESFSVQAYFDHMNRNESLIKQRHNTFDLDFQHRRPLGARQELLWGLSYRHVRDDITSAGVLALDPSQRSVSHYGAFVQSEITLGETTRMIVGSKFDRNAFSGFEYQPNLRMVWQPNGQHTVWGSIARAVRTPSRAEQDGTFLLTPPTNTLFGDPDLGAVNLMAIEFGYRFTAGNGLSLDLTAFHNEYRDLIGTRLSLPPSRPPLLDLALGNNLKGQSDGFEAALSWQVMNRWRLSGNYTYIDLDVEPASGGQNETVFAGLPTDTAPHQLTIDSDLTLSDNWFLHVRGQYVDALPASIVPGSELAASLRPESYTGLDASLTWRQNDSLEVLFSGKNLLGNRFEFLGETFTPASDIGRMMYLQLRMRWQ
ncbi:MAG: TonB-dependent receptor [Pseudomonadota bacterium]